MGIIGGFERVTKTLRGVGAGGGYRDKERCRGCRRIERQGAV